MRRRLRIAMVAATILTIAILVALRWRSAPRDSRMAAARSTAETLPSPTARISSDRQSEATHEPSPPSPAPPVNLALVTAQELRQRARYPHSSQPLRAEDGDPIVRDRQVSQNRFPGPNGEDPVLVVFPDQVSFEHPETVILHAHLSDGTARVPARSIEGEIVDALGQQLGRLTYVANGLDHDGDAADLEYTARLTETESGALAGGSYLVRVRAFTADGEERTGTTGFLYSRPTAQPTGRYADAVVDGNLEVRAEVQVQEAGRFHLEGTLYTQAGAPVAWAQNALTLAPGTRWIPLSFFGLILHERGEDGPYLLRFAALSTVTAMPNAKNRLLENAHVTNPYGAAEFSDQPYNDPQLLDAAKRIDQAAKGGNTFEAEGGTKRGALD